MPNPQSLIPNPSSLPRQRHSPRIAPRSVRRGASRWCVQGCLAVVVGVGVRGGWFLLRQGYGGQWSSLSLRWRGARRGGWLVPISSGAGLGLLRPLRGSLRSGNPTPTARANLAFHNDRGLAPAPDGASCENHPRIRPYLVVAPSGAAFWVGVRVSQRLYNHQTRAEGLVRDKSQLGG